jgi:hypothetical protein
MILEHRTDAFRPGSVGGWMNKYENDGPPIEQKRLNMLVGFDASEIGRLHPIVPMSVRDNLLERETRRKAMEADSDWRRFIDEVFRLDAILSQHARIANPAPFSPTTEMGRA